MAEDREKLATSKNAPMPMMAKATQPVAPNPSKRGESSDLISGSDHPTCVAAIVRSFDGVPARWAIPVGHAHQPAKRTSSRRGDGSLGSTAQCRALLLTSLPGW